MYAFHQLFVLSKILGKYNVWFGLSLKWLDYTGLLHSVLLPLLIIDVAPYREILIAKIHNAPTLSSRLFEKPLPAGESKIWTKRNALTWQWPWFRIKITADILVIK